MTPPITHTDGVIRLGETTLTLTEAETLWHDSGSEWIIAADARDRAVKLDLPLDIMRARAEMDRLSGLENALRWAIHDAKRYAKAMISSKEGK